MLTARFVAFALILGTILSTTAKTQPTSGTRQIVIQDPFLHQTMEVLDIPANWSGAGTILRGVGCGTQFPHDVFRASSADGLTGFQFMPPVIWYQSDAPSAFVSGGADHCAKLGSTSPTQIALSIAGTRPAARVVSVAEHFNDAIFAHNVQLAGQQLAAVSNGRSTLAGDEGRVTITYEMNGHPVEELLIAQDRMQHFQTLLLGSNGMPRGGSGTLVQHSVTIIALRAPRGQLSSLQDHMLSMIRSRQPDPQWQSAEQVYEQRVREQQMQAFQRMEAANQASFEAEQARFKQQAAATLANTRRTMAQTQVQNDQLIRTGQDQIDFLAGNQFYLNPATGQTYTISSYDGRTYEHTGDASDKSFLRTNDAEVQMGLPSDWVELKAISH